MSNTACYRGYWCEYDITEDDPFVGWAKDPYDDTIREGALMNLSEREEFDEQFPGFPLSMCREFVRTVN